MRTLTACRGDLRFQLRHGIHTAYALVVVFYALLLANAPAGMRPVATVLVLFSDTSVVGFFFIGGILLLERRQGITSALFVTPLRADEYLTAKLASLTLLAVLASALLMLVAGVPMRGFGTGLLGVALSSVFFILVGVIVAARSETVNGYFLRGTLFSILFTLPLFDYLQLFRLPLGRLLPTHGALVLMDGMFHSIGRGPLLGAVALLAVWNVAAWIWARSSFLRFVVHREGGIR